MYPDFQRFLGNCAVHRTRGGSALHFDNRHRPPAVGSRGDRSTAVVGSHSGDKHVAPVRVAQLTLVDDRPTVGLKPATKGRVSLLEAYGLSAPLSVDDVRRVDYLDW